MKLDERVAPGLPPRHPHPAIFSRKAPRVLRGNLPAPGKVVFDNGTLASEMQSDGDRRCPWRNPTEFLSAEHVAIKNIPPCFELALERFEPTMARAQIYFEHQRFFEYAPFGETHYFPIGQAPQMLASFASEVCGDAARAHPSCWPPDRARRRHAPWGPRPAAERAIQKHPPPRPL